MNKREDFTEEYKGIALTGSVYIDDAWGGTIGFAIEITNATLDNHLTLMNSYPTSHEAQKALLDLAKQHIDIIL